MSWLDIVVIGIIGLNAFISYQRGFIKTLFKFVSLIVSVMVTMYVYPYVSQFLIHNTGVYATIKDWIIGLLKLEGASETAQTTGDQINFIGGLQIPEAFKHILVTNNNSEIYNLLDVNNLGDYIGGMVATLIINIIAFLGVFIIVSILMKVVISLVDLVSKLPVLNQINKLGGLVIGAIIGVIVVWFLGLVISMLSANPSVANVYETLQVSEVAKFFYDNNLLMKVVTNISKSIVK